MTDRSSKKTVVFYHAQCLDGFSAAWAAWKKFGSAADYIPLSYGLPIPIEPAGADVIFVDFLPKEEAVLNAIVRNNASVIAIDHHKTNAEKIKAVPTHSFDLAKSGAVLAWEFFHPGEPVPRLLRHVQDMDIWQWKLENSEQIVSYLDLVPMTFENWSDLVDRIENDSARSEIIAQGALLLKYQDKLIDEIIKHNVQPVEFEGYRTSAVNSSVFSSHIGARLSRAKPPIAIIWQQRSGITTVSLRSDGSVDCGALAAKYGGGGHVGAAGFELAFSAPVPWKIIKTDET
ncbi:MAG TPA: phosphohydrolase [Candidatus Paceibacterota bacterium]|nr:phosphohydrolase [Candidatus Paceibacterota bacterium]